MPFLFTKNASVSIGKYDPGGDETLAAVIWGKL
jgi:hypothetical protein